MSNSYLKDSNCEIICEHITKLEREKSSNLELSLIKSINESDDDNESFDKQYFQIILQVRKLEKERSFSELISFINEQLPIIDDTSLKENLLISSFKAARKIFDFNECNRIIEKLIEIDPRDSNYYIYKAQIVEDLDEKLSVLDNAINVNPFLSVNYNNKAEILSEKLESLSGTDLENTTSEISELLKKSVILNPALSNDAWELMFDHISNSDDKDKEEKLTNLIENLKKQSLYSPIISNLILNYCKKTKTREYNGQDVIEIIKSAKEKFYPENHISHCITLIDAFHHFNEKELLRTFLLELDEDKNLKNKRSYILAKSKALANSLADFDQAIETILNFKDFEKHSDLIVNLIKLLIDSERFEEAQIKLDFYSNIISKDTIIDLQTDLFNYQGKIQEALECFQKTKKTKYNAETIATNTSYYYLRMQDYKTAKKITHDFLSLSHINFNVKYAQTILNYEYAKHKLGSNYSKERISSVLNTSSRPTVKAVCHYFLGHKEDVLNELKEYLKSHYAEITTIINWAVFEDIKGDLIKLKDQLKS